MGFMVFAERELEVFLCFRVIGPNFQGLPKMFGGLAPLFFAKEGDAQIVVGDRVVRLELQRLLEMVNGIAQITLA